MICSIGGCGEIYEVDNLERRREMPTYEYECLECGEKIEIFHKVTDSPIKKCPSCNGEVRKLISAGCGLIFKGSGFYITDYKRKEASSKEATATKKDTKDSRETKDTKKQNEQ